MASNDRVSVTIVTYNSGRFIKRCLESVLAQKYVNKESIVVDNASTDGTIDILEQFEDRCQIIYNDENIGFAAAQNQAIRASRGEWVLTLNPDVLLLPNFIQALVDAGQFDSKIGTVCGKLLRWDPGGDPEFTRMIERGTLILDIGSGAGYPGLILAAASKANFILTEPRRKKQHFLEAAAAEMGLENVEVEPTYAEAVDPGDGFDFVTVKGVRVDHGIFAAAARVLKLGGMLIVYASAKQQFDNRIAEKVGLGHPISAHYDLRRSSLTAEMALATWLRI